MGDPNTTTLELVGELDRTLFFVRKVRDEDRRAARKASSGSAERDDACPSLETAFLIDTLRRKLDLDAASSSFGDIIMLEELFFFFGFNVCIR